MTIGVEMASGGEGAPVGAIKVIKMFRLTRLLRNALDAELTGGRCTMQQP